MPITIPKTWASGEVLTAADLNSNISALKSGVANTDSSWWVTGKWIEAKHIVSPFIESVQNATHHVSGWYCSQNSGSLFVSGSFVSRFESSLTNTMTIPKTSITVPVAHPCSWFYQFWACVESRNNGDAQRGNGEFYAGIGGVGSANVAAVYLEQEKTASGNKSIISGRTYCNSYNFGTQTTPANLNLGVSGFAGDASAQLVSWGFTVECFYI